MERNFSRRLIILPALALAGGALLTGTAFNPEFRPWVRYGTEPVISGTAGNWDARQVHTPRVVFDGSNYHMWYTGFNDRYLFGYAWSLDGISWHKPSDRPVLDLAEPSGWFIEAVHFPHVIYENGEYKMWYDGRWWGGGAIGYATSPDGMTWTKHERNPIFGPGPAGAFDDRGVYSPVVVGSHAGYEMWYTAQSRSGALTLGYATSADGISWVRHPQPVLEPSQEPWEAPGVSAPFVVKESDGNYRMWYQGHGVIGRIGYAESMNGIDWQKGPNPLLDLVGENMHSTYDPAVVRVGNVYRMWYTVYRVGNPFASIYLAEAQAPDSTPPVVLPTVEGLSGTNGWYTSDVSLSWTVTDPESAVTATQGCEHVSVETDTTGVTFTCRATSSGGTTTSTVSIKRDTIPPSVACSVTPSLLWPANHKLRKIVATVTASDATETVVTRVEVGGSEADSGLGDGDLPGDIQGFERGTTTTGLLRAERYSRQGRTYTVKLVVADEAGNENACSADVRVPHDQSSAASRRN